VHGEIHHPRVSNEGEQRETAVYRLYDGSDRLLYVGISHNPIARWGTHSGRSWWPDAARFMIVWHSTRRSAAKEERAAIQSESPLHNIQGTEQGRLATGMAVRAALTRQREWRRENAEARATTVRIIN
jgi:hypothetical protein